MIIGWVPDAGKGSQEEEAPDPGGIRQAQGVRGREKVAFKAQRGCGESEDLQGPLERPVTKERTDWLQSDP